jgi:hypothetical protein
MMRSYLGVYARPSRTGSMSGIKLEARCPYGDCNHIDDVYWDPNDRSCWEHECGSCAGVYEIDIEYSMSMECRKLGDD